MTTIEVPRFLRLPTLCAAATGLSLSAAFFLTAPLSSAAEGDGKMAKEGSTEIKKVSYWEEVRPVLQAKCQGCHQPAKSKGGYIMTEVAKLIAGGETDKAVVPHEPDKSFLVELTTPVDGEVEMPPKGDALTEAELHLVRQWIAEGAVDDTPDNARQQFDMNHPPKYAVAPVITSMDFSPDGKLLAVSGFHEVLLHKADGSGLVARLVGLSERIESVRFSPDGKSLAVTGGLPARMGEVQIWDVAKKELTLSKPVGYDTAYGASWSPDGKLVAFGQPDKTVRAINASSGEQVLFMGGHDDWVLDTVFSVKGDHLVSVGRDMAAKLTKVETERFMDNITSITPGALRGGLLAIDRHPGKDEILIGGADGVPQIYRMYRETARRIGDNANLIRKFPAMKGRIWGVAYSPDGKQIVAASSLDGKGYVNIYSADFDSALPEIVKTAFGKVATTRTAEEVKAVEEYSTKDVKLIAGLEFPESRGIYSVAYSPDGKTIVVGGADGQVRFLNAADGKLAKAMTPVTVDGGKAMAKRDAKPVKLDEGTADRSDPLPKGDPVVALDVVPKTIDLSAPNAYNQLVVTAQLKSGAKTDATRNVKWEQATPLLEISRRGIAKPVKEGEAVLIAALGDIKTEVPVKISGLNQEFHPDFVRDVNPVISKLGCNAGTCHGAKDGKEGFKLSLRGYDPIFDVRAFGDDHAARRVNYASPDDSLMLLKATAAVPHEGGQVTKPHSEYYDIVRQWISNGTMLDLTTPKVKQIELFPKNPVLQRIGERQQIRVVATYADGAKRDVTAEAFVESGNLEVATHDKSCLITTIRRGEAPVLARYEGAYAATTVTVMGKRDGFTWTEQPEWNPVDKFVANKWQRMKILPSGLCTDEEFLRRIYLDLTGLPPSADQVRAFVADKQETRQKRDAVVDKLIGSPEFVDHWTNKWCDLLQVNSKFLGKEGAEGFRTWIKNHVEKNTPYDEFVYSIVDASGSNADNPAASYYKILRTPEELVENTTHLFLATRFNCNKCHDHPFERWTQDQYYETAAYFARVDLKTDNKNSAGKKIGGTAVEGAKPLYEIVSDKAEGEVKHDRTGEIAAPEFPYPVKFEEPKEDTRRAELAAWITSPDNQYFAMSYANRLWGYLIGTGVIEPLDDIRAGNPPSNPELLNWLTSEFVNSGFDARHVMRLICKSRTYQLSVASNEWNEDDTINFSHAKARRLPAEVLFDAVYASTGSVPNIPGAKPGMRAAQLADSQTDLASGFLAGLGRPPRESACECERSNDVQLGNVMSLLSGPTIADAVGDEKNAIAKLVKQQPDDKKLVEEIFLRILNRKPSEAEVKAALESMSQIEEDHMLLVASLAKKEGEWVPVRAERERNRLIAIDKATADIAAYQPEHDKKVKEAEAAQKTRIAEADAVLKKYEEQLPGLAQAWEKELKLDRLWTTWQPLMPKDVKASKAYEAKTLENGAVLISGQPANNADYVVTIPASQKNITGLMVEALPHDDLPGFGPGINPNGNFVVSEIELQYKDAGDPKAKAVKAKFVKAEADFNQSSFDVKRVIDGDVARNNKAWAVGGKEKNPHWARLQLDKPIAFEKGAELTVTIRCRYSNGDYPLGHFRLWMTDSAQPLNLGLPEAVAAAMKVAPEARSAEQKQALVAYYRDQDNEYLKRRHALAGEKRPLPADPKMVGLKGALAKAERPIQQDGQLLQLRKDVDMSIQQSANRRLTAAQDLTWALINSPAFLFNH